MTHVCTIGQPKPGLSCLHPRIPRGLCRFAVAIFLSPCGGTEAKSLLGPQKERSVKAAARSPFSQSFLMVQHTVIAPKEFKRFVTF